MNCPNMTTPLSKARRHGTAFVLAAMFLSVVSLVLLRLQHNLTSQRSTRFGHDGTPSWQFNERVPTPEERLQELNADYTPGRYDGFGVGSADLARYREELVDFVRAINLTSKDVPSPSRTLPHTNTPSLVRSLECHLELRCRAASATANAVRRGLFATASKTSAFSAPNMLEWQRINPGYAMNFYTDEQVFAFVHDHFPTESSSVSKVFDTLPLEIIKYDWFRYLAVGLYGGFYADVDTYPLKSLDALLSAQPFQKVIDRTDRLLVPDHDPTAPPGLVVGVEWTGRQNNLRNVLFGRKLGIVQWGFGASQGHPVLIESAKRVLENSVRSSKRDWDAREGKGPEDMLPFNPAQDKTKPLVLEWSGPAVFTDCVARYLQTCYGISLSSLAHTTEPIRIGDVLLLPIAALQVPKYSAMRWLNWFLGREFHPWSEQWHVMRHDHTHVWWAAAQKSKTKPTTARER
ncbi:BQ5605_C110g13214 [Microbotryum silenes-dioicae]|uniref:BQ5605_C017g08333 protein n=1 Tax=Microbotryum silenes-dioicae TaxID=796604 RepID=A0A2X0MPC9_9BASI|nr:BQ5605_C017g08333 [Microbotryum silenes-dioicae]SGZ30199.1 BQ5605_C110g13214 [Microbotryum silenes-dioicae]